MFLEFRSGAKLYVQLRRVQQKNLQTFCDNAIKLVGFDKH